MRRVVWKLATAAVVKLEVLELVLVLAELVESEATATLATVGVRGHQGADQGVGIE